MDKIAVEEIQAVVGSKEEFWCCLVKNGWYLPKYKSTIIKIEYLMQVLDGTLWVPMFEEVRLRPCPLKPPKTLLMKELLQEATQQEKTLGLIEGKFEADAGWLLNVLSTLKPSHRFFQKSFYPSLEKAKQRQIQ